MSTSPQISETNIPVLPVSPSLSSLTSPILPIQTSNLFTTPPHAQLSFSLKLKETNYLAWKTQFLPIIKCYNLNQHIDGTPAPLPIITDSTTNLPSPNPEYIKWVQEDQLLLSWICSSLTEEVMPYVTGIENARDAWVSLSDAFGTSNSAVRVQLHIALQNLSFGDKSVAKFLREAKVISDALAAAGTPISTDEFNATIFRLLPSEYHPVIATLSASKTQITFSELSSQLMSHEILIQNSNRASPILANFARQNNSGSHSAVRIINVAVIIAILGRILELIQRVPNDGTLIPVKFVVSTTIRPSGVENGTIRIPIRLLLILLMFQILLIHRIGLPTLVPLTI